MPITTEIKTVDGQALPITVLHIKLSDYTLDSSQSGDLAQAALLSQLQKELQSALKSPAGLYSITISVVHIEISPDSSPHLTLYLKPIVQALSKAGIKAPLCLFDTEGSAASSEIHKQVQEIASSAWSVERSALEEKKTDTQLTLIPHWLEQVHQSSLSSYDSSHAHILDYAGANCNPRSPEWLWRQLMGSRFLQLFLTYLEGLEGDQITSLSFSVFSYGTPWTPYSNFGEDLRAIAQCPHFPFKLTLPSHRYSDGEFEALLALITVAYDKGIPQINLSGTGFSSHQLGQLFALLQTLNQQGKDFCYIYGFENREYSSANSWGTNQAGRGFYQQIADLCQDQAKRAFVRVLDSASKQELKKKVSEKASAARRTAALELKIALPPQPAAKEHKTKKAEVKPALLSALIARAKNQKLKQHLQQQQQQQQQQQHQHEQQQQRQQANEALQSADEKQKIITYENLPRYYNDRTAGVTVRKQEVCHLDAKNFRDLTEEKRVADYDASWSHYVGYGLGLEHTPQGMTESAYRRLDEYSELFREGLGYRLPAGFLMRSVKRKNQTLRVLFFDPALSESNTHPLAIKLRPLPKLADSEALKSKLRPALQNNPLLEQLISKAYCGPASFYQSNQGMCICPGCRPYAPPNPQDEQAWDDELTAIFCPN